MKSASKGASLRLADVAKDQDGFDDLDEFWNASGKSLCPSNLRLALAAYASPRRWKALSAHRASFHGRVSLARIHLFDIYCPCLVRVICLFCVAA